MEESTAQRFVRIVDAQSSLYEAYARRHGLQGKSLSILLWLYYSPAPSPRNSSPTRPSPHGRWSIPPSANGGRKAISSTQTDLKQAAGNRKERTKDLTDAGSSSPSPRSAANGPDRPWKIYARPSLRPWIVFRQPIKASSSAFIRHTQTLFTWRSGRVARLEKMS